MGMDRTGSNQPDSEPRCANRPVTTRCGLLNERRRSVGDLIHIATVLDEVLDSMEPAVSDAVEHELAETPQQEQAPT